SWLVWLMSYCTRSIVFIFFFSSRRRHTRSKRDWSSDVCSSDLRAGSGNRPGTRARGSGASAAGRAGPRARRRRRRPAWSRARRRSEERRVGKECRSRWSAYHKRKKDTVCKLFMLLIADVKRPNGITIFIIYTPNVTIILLTFDNREERSCLRFYGCMWGLSDETFT